MGALNRVMLIGNLGKDPEVRYTQSGQAVANFTMATTDSWTDKQGQKQEKTEWHKVVAWGKIGELCGEYLAKGRQTYVEGHLQTREWTDKENRKNYTTEIVADKVVFLGGREGGAARGGRSSDPQPPDERGQGAAPGGGPTEEDIPF